MNSVYAALFVLYNPSQNQINNILILSQYFDKVYIYDNTEKENNNSKSFTDEKIIYIGSQSNDGLSVAYNKVLRKAAEENITWLSIFDQDSEITGTMISTMRDFAKNIDNKRIASLVPIIQYDDKIPEQTDSIPVLWAINSGQMLNVNLITSTNLYYDENLFLDRVDRDFCKQIQIARLQIIQVKGAILKQQLGEKYKSFFIHSPIRNYYMFKNRLYYNKKYFNSFKAFILSFLQSLKHIINIIRVGKDLKANLKMIRLAYKDFKLKKMGKIG